MSARETPCGDGRPLTYPSRRAADGMGVYVPRYLVLNKLSAEGIAATTKAGFVSRQAVVENMWRNAGGRLEAWYHGPSSAEYDLVAIVNVPSTDTLYAITNGTLSNGSVARCTTIELRSSEEAEAAVARTPIDFSDPGG